MAAAEAISRSPGLTALRHDAWFTGLALMASAVCHYHAGTFISNHLLKDGLKAHLHMLLESFRLAFYFAVDDTTKPLLSLAAP